LLHFCPGGLEGAGREPLPDAKIDFSNLTMEKIRPFLSNTQLD